jgi:hypothetical protein
MFLLSPNKSLQARLGAIVASGAVDFGASYLETTDDGLDVTSLDQSDGELIGTTPVVVVGAPGATLRRQVKDVWFHNGTDAVQDLLFQNNNNGVVREILTVALPVNATLYIPDSEKPGIVHEDEAALHTVQYFAGGSTNAGKVAFPDWITPHGAIPVWINGSEAISAEAVFQMRTTDPATSVTCRWYNLTDDVVAALSDACTDADTDFSQPDQRQTKALSLGLGNCQYELQYLGGNADTDVIASSYILTREI